MTLALGEVTIGHVLDVLARWPAASVHCVVTSPPYWALRKYAGEQEVMWPGGARSAYGLEPLHDCGRPAGELCSVCYVCHTLTVLRAIRRVLRPDGVVWWNLGDSYAGSGGAHANDVNPGISQSFRRFGGAGDTIGSDGYERRNRNERGRAGPSPGLKPGDLCMIPQRVALAAQADGWFVRSEVIWHKPSCMPETISGWSWQQHQVKVEREESADCLGCMKCANPISLPTPGGIITGRVGHRVPTGRTETIWQDCPGCPKCTPNDGLVLRRGSWRPTTAHEKVLMFAASADYWADGEDVREKHETVGDKSAHAFGKKSNANGMGGQATQGNAHSFHSGGRNLRTVWTFPTVGYPSAHFATFPPALPTRCILAACPPRVCRECGAPWARVVERYDTGRQQKMADGWDTGAGAHATIHRNGREDGESGKPVMGSRTLGWRPTCSCGADWLPGIVLDPFAGSGTTLKVAEDLGRRWVGIEICEQYLELIRQRLGRVTELPIDEGERRALPLE